MVSSCWTEAAWWCVFSFKRLSVRVVILASSCDSRRSQPVLNRGHEQDAFIQIKHIYHIKQPLSLTMRIIFFYLWRLFTHIQLLSGHLWDAVLGIFWCYWESWGIFPFASTFNCLAEKWTTQFCFQHIPRVHHACKVNVQPVICYCNQLCHSCVEQTAPLSSYSDFTAAHLWGNSSSFFLVVKAERGSRLWAKLLFFLSRRIESPPAFTVRAVGPNPPLLITNYPLTVTIV